MKRCIELAKGYGINVTVGYEVHFDLIEKKVNRGDSETEILYLIEKLESRLNDQLKFDILMLSDDRPGVKTAYVQKVAEFIAPLLDKIKTPVKGENLLIQIDNGGNVNSIKPSTEHGATTESIGRLKTLIESLGKFPSAPVENLVLHIDAEELPASRHICLYEGQNLDNFLKSLQRRIKSHWDPESAAEDSLVNATFTIYSDGTIKDIKLEKPSKNKNHNEAAIRALQESSPIPLLPDGFYKDKAARFTFAYKVGKRASD